MSTIQGPKIQVPSDSEIFTLKYDSDGKIVGAEMTQPWLGFFHAIQQAAYAGTRSGPTSSRPISTMVRYTGMGYFDTTLGKPVFLKIASSNAWVLADGTGA